MSNGTDMKIFAPIIAEKYGLEYTPSGDVNEAVAHLQSGGQIVVHVGVPDGEKTGLFTVGGHYMLLTTTDGKEFCILDPSYTPEKYFIPERVGKVNVSHAPYLYCDIHTLHAQRRVGRKYVYHMFKRKR